MTPLSLMRYALQLDVLERDSQLGDAAALALLRREFALALNAAHFSRLSAGDIAVEVLSRAIPQDGVARYTVALELEERTPQMTHEQAAELVSRELQHALNGSHFMRISGEDFPATLVSRAPVATPVKLPA